MRRLPQQLLHLLLLLPLLVHAQEPVSTDGAADADALPLAPPTTLDDIATTSPPSVLTIALVTTLMAAATGLGAAPFFFIRKLNPRLAALANTVASGVMLACSFDLIHEGQPHGPLATIAGVLLGALFISYSHKHLESCDDPTFDALRGADARKALLMVGVMTLHALGEGSGVGVSFAGSRGWSQGTLVSVAIGLHNVPEGLAVASVMASKGSPPSRTLLWTLVTALPQPLVAVPSYLFVNTFAALLPLALGFAAGCMVWIVLAELLPEAMEHLEPQVAATSATFSAAGLEGLRMLVGQVEAASDAASIVAPEAGGLLPHTDWGTATKSLMELVLLLLLPAAAASALATAAGAQLLGGPARLGAATGAMAAAAAAGALRVVGTQGVSLGGVLGWGAVGVAGLAAAKWALQQMEQSRAGAAGLQAQATYEVTSRGGPPEGTVWANGNGAVPVNAQVNGNHWSLPLPSSPSKRGTEGGRNGFVAAAAAKLSMQGSAELPYSSKVRPASGPLAALRRAASLGALCLAVQCVAPGLYAAAYAVQADSIHDVSQLGPPLALIGIIMGTITLGLIGALAPHPPALPPLRALITLAAAPAALLVAAAACLGPHLAEGDVEAISARMAQAGHRWTIVASAAALPCCLLCLWPAARTTRPHAAAAGLVLGLLVGCFASVGVELLCAGTPYCLFVPYH